MLMARKPTSRRRTRRFTLAFTLYHRPGFETTPRPGLACTSALDGTAGRAQAEWRALRIGDGMRRSAGVRTFGLVGVVVLALAADVVAATGPNCVNAAKPTPGAALPRTPWGDPDLQGVWSGAEMDGVPLERAPEFGTRNTVTDEEFRSRGAQLQQGASPNNIEATNFGIELELSGSNPTRQASLVVDPPNGRRPPRTPEAVARQPARSSFSTGPFDSVLDLGPYDRCIAFSSTPAAHPFNGLQIVQGPGYVAIQSEVVHEARVISLDGRPHVSGSIKTYMGDSRGRWEGQTLVVETSNMNGQTNLQGNGGGRLTARATVTERYTVVDQGTLWYEATIDDPGTWTRPWTVAFPRKRATDYALFEYACHEGNYGLPNILSASRANETSTER